MGKTTEIKPPGHESIVIEEIIARILRELNRKFLTASNDLFGIESRVEELLEKYLHMGLDDVRFVGICGMGGIGKTTIAQVIHKKISYQFEASCFIANVREETKNQRLVSLQEKLLSKILMGSEIKLGGIHEGIDIMGKRLLNKKVLIVLDDVDSEEQLEALAGKLEWFGQGSRIIITSRDRHLLKRHIVDDNIYMAKLLNDEEALQLFSWKAFKKYSPEKNYVGLSKYFVDYAMGLPLALKVLGSSLYSKGEKAWESVRDQLKAHHNSNIQNVLKISYDRLQEPEKKLFLDIACFFKGEDRDRIRDILQSLDCFPNVNIDVLINKSHTNIVGGKWSKHDSLQEKGKEIVCQESLKEPGGPSRLSFNEDVLHVLKNNTGTEAVQRIFLNTHVQKEEHLNAESFTGMKRMRLPEIRNVQLPQDLNYLPNRLSVTKCHGYPLKSMPTSFQPTKVVELRMRCSCMEQLWKAIKRSNDLKLIDLSASENLTETPDFSWVPNLERLLLQGCTRLLKIHPSIAALEKLILLNLQDCKSLNSLPSKINLKFLETLNLSGCSRLKKFPEIGENMTCLSKLFLDETAIIELPPSFENLSGIILLSLRDCKNISILPNVICRLSSLKTLILSGCSRLNKMPENLSGMKCLEELDASETAIREFPSSILHMTKLRKLSFHGCKDLPPQSWDLLFCCPLLPKESSGPVSLLLPDSFSGLSSLVSLNLSDCNLLDGAIPNDLSSLSSLQSLNLSGNKFISLPDSICQLSMLRDLTLRNCSRLQALPNLPLSILHVWVENCTSLETYSNQIHARTTSETLAIINCSGSVTLEEGKIRKICVSNAQTNLFVQNLKAQIYQDNIICGSSMGTEIPMWFKEQSTSPFVIIEIQPDLDYGSKWMGYALFIVYEVHENENMNVGIFNYSESTLDLTKDIHQFACHFETNEGSLKTPKVLIGPKVPFVGPIAIWGYIPHAQFSELSNDLDKWTYIEVKIASIPGVVVKKCGARLLYQQDASEFVDTIGQYSLGDLYDDHSDYHELADFMTRLPAGSNGEAEAECTSSSTSLSSPIAMEDQLERDFYPLLLKCFQVTHAQNKMYKYIFPIRASPSWFIAHGLGNSISMSLPPNLNDDKRWIGFALYASFAVHNEHQTVSRDSKVSRSFFCLLCTEDGCLQSFIVLPLTRDIFVESHRLLVLHIPRVFFTHKLNQRKSIRALFGGFNNSDLNIINSDVEVEVCGMRMVFEQDLEGLVQRIFDCISSSPDIYHQGYRQGLEDQEKCLSSYVHAQEESTGTLYGNMPHDFDCSSSSQRMSQSMRKQHVGQQYFDSLETYLGEPMARSDLRDSNFNIMQEGFDQTRVLSKCFPWHEIPHGFCCHNGSSMRTKVPQNLYNNPDWIGVALCATFTFLKHPTLIHDNLRSEISHGLTCLIGSDVGWTLRLRSNFTESEFNESIWLNQRVFIWVLYISHVSILDKLKKFGRLNTLFESESPYLMVEKCGHSIVCQQNVEAFEQMIIQGSFTPPDISQLTHHVVQDNNENNKEASTSGTRYSSETHHVVQDDNGNNNKEASTSGTSYSSERLKAPFYQGESSSTSNQPHVNEHISKCFKT
ncbi:TMV resistance protein N-like [Castanea sativa]|uniref:TMV resistance protein N-like n=1 Tax=Castanea sativa TaxID=21020 RepID=UPI003F653048